ncbi:MAG: hypothetical protein ACYCUI_15120 [Vulcanimicrobiaceae bacterium]
MPPRAAAVKNGRRHRAPARRSAFLTAASTAPGLSEAGWSVRPAKAPHCSRELPEGLGDRGLVRDVVQTLAAAVENAADHRGYRNTATFACFVSRLVAPIDAVLDVFLST